MANEHVVIVGAGHAGGTVAAQLRQQGFDGPITLIGDEGEAPYQRPPLSKAWLLGSLTPDELYLKPRRFYAEQGITLLNSTEVRQIEAHGQVLHLDNGATLVYDRLVIATGARARRLELPGAQARGVLYLRDLRDADQLAVKLRRASRLIVLGGGYIGLEVAATARKMGLDVVVLEREQALLARVASRAVADWVQAMHENAGVRFRLGAAVTALRSTNGVLTGLALANGEVLDGDLLLVGVGALPNDDLARHAGLTCEQGVVVDDMCRTSHPAVYAIGDVARVRMPNGHLAPRIESVANALDQARRVACSIVGSAPPPPETPWFWSEQYDTRLQIVGIRSAHATQVVRTRDDGHGLIVLYEQGDRLIAAETINSPRDFMIAKRAIAAHLS
jgi:3-phenylpropionate/trans-cinnamate dioxygenase ferredoxin reductase subunit